MTELGALQTTLEAEHAAVYVYAVLGARTSESGSPALYAALRDAYDAHRERRDGLVSEIAQLGANPAPAATAYELPPGLETARGVTRAALLLERACAETYASLVANTAGRQRARAVEALTNAAVRELAFRGTPEMFPGAGEYADR
jgi:hypothetical protein